MATAADRCLLRLVGELRPKRPAALGARTTAMFEQLRAEARAEEIELLRFIYGGSIEKGTGLRRYRDRECSIPGQAVDLVIEVAPGEPITHELHVRLASIAERCFIAAGQADELDFRRDRLRWRLLPIFAQRGPEGFVQRLVLPDRTRLTSVRVHARDVRQRTRKSVEQYPSIGFNDCVRLLKWWQAVRPDAAELPSFVLERLAIAAFDRLGVRDGFATTLAAWTEYLATFDPLEQRALIDPVSDELLIAWSDQSHRALQQWFADGAQALREAGELTDEHALAEQLAARMFGPELVRAVAGRSNGSV
jgi:hypothetical protein